MAIKLFTKNYNKWLFALAAIFFIFTLSVIGAYFIFEKKYQKKIYPGIYLGNIYMGGLTIDNAKKIINSKIDQINQHGIVFHYHNQDTTLYPLIASLEGDIAIEIISFDVNDTINQLYLYGRKGNYWQNLRNILNALMNNPKHGVIHTVNTEEVLRFLENSFSHFTTPSQNAKLIYEKKSAYSPYEFSVKPETYGQTLNYEAAIARLLQNITILNSGQIDLGAIIDYPEIYEKDTSEVIKMAKEILDKTPITLAYKNNEWLIENEQLIEWLTLKRDENSLVIVGLDSVLASDLLEKNISPDINQEVIEAKFEIKNGKVSEFQVPRDGRKLDLLSSVLRIEEAVIGDGEKVELVVNELTSQTQTGEINNFGIQKIIGTGHSSFAGSPKNRRHNIAVGAGTLNGILLKPNDEFSLLKALGEVNAEAGYLPELVIKEGKTIPEYGGGLCQIGTTIFRATLSSGLPITQRRNHSFRVSYYEPAGTDATIYDPWPDYRFVNDTPNHVLVQTRIVGDDLYFDFWGSGDGRTASQTKPIIYNIVRPAPTKIIETLDLSPGVKKCTEHAVNGADAYFDYIVTYTDGTVKKNRFSSHYVPWREVCLVGVEELSTTTLPILN